MRRRWLVVLLPAALVALGLYVRTLAEGAFAAFTDYETPFVFPGAPAPKAEPMVDHVVLVLVDGLGLEPSRSMAHLGELRARGADYGVRIGLPSLSQPGRAVIATGAWQEVHGQSTNIRPRRLRVDHIFAAVRRAGGSTVLSGMGEGVARMFAPHVERPVLFEEPPETAPLATYVEVFRRMADRARELAAEKPTLLFAEMLVVDEAGHNWGGASEEYRQAVALVDEEIGRLAASIDLSRTTLVVTADHGHVPAGGHGGPEPSVMDVPLVLLGAGIRPGVTGTATQADIASTLAVLLGTDIPTANQGRPLLDALALDRAGRVDALRRLYAQRREFVRHYTAWLRGPDAARLDQTDAAAPSTEVELHAALDGLDTAVAQARAERMALDARVRSRFSLAFGALPLVAFGVLLAAGAVRGREALAALGWGVAGLAVYHASLPVLGLGYSFSAVNKDEWMEPFFLKDMIAGGLSCALVVVLASLVRSRAGRSVAGLAGARLAWLVAGAFCALLAIKIAVIYWRHGVFLVWHMPDMYWGFGFYLDALALLAVALASPALPLLAWATGRLAGRPPAPEQAHAA